MKRPCVTHEGIRFLLSLARPMTDEERHRQMISLAYGNVAMENARITKEMVTGALSDAAPGADGGKEGGK